MRALKVFLLLVCLAAPARAAPPDALPDGGTDTVATVMDGDSFRLSGGGADVRFVAIQAPKLPKGRKGFKAWPYGEEARQALEDMVRGHRVTLRLAETPRDRNGRTLAHIVRDDGVWLQLELVRQGWARVYTFPDNRQFARELLAAEREARAAKRGLWRDATYNVRTADPAALAKDTGTFQIVEGRVRNAAKVRGRVYLNFGDDFKTDFTAVIPPDVMPLFTKAKLDPLTLKDKTVRVRGYIRDFNGPSVDISHPEQVEVEP
jgi:endonuclease YncB( thermonuclease family)